MVAQTAQLKAADGQRRASSSGGGSGRGRRSSKVPSNEAIEQLRQVAGFLCETPRGEGGAYVTCVQAAASQELVKHADREVRRWAASCLAEGLRIFAPEPPLDKEQLRDALELFLEQLGGLSDPDQGNGTFIPAFSLLERLVNVSAFMLIFECEGFSDALLVKLVRVCLNAARSSAGGTLETMLERTLSGVLSEADSIPSTALMELLADLVPRRQQQKSAAGLVRQVLTSLADHSAAVLSVNGLLNSALYGQALALCGGIEGLESATGQEGNGALLCTVHELFTIDPRLVARVLPNLHTDLESDNNERRRAASIWVGRMLAHLFPCPSKSRAPLLVTHPLLLDSFLERLADAEEEVRLAALEGVAALLSTLVLFPGDSASPARAPLLKASTALKQRLLERSLDPSDAVRLSVVKLSAAAAGSAAGLELLAPVLPEIFRRILDKRPSIRTACALAVAELYAKHGLPAWTRSSEGAGRDTNMAWVPQLLCEAFSVFVGNHLGQTALLEELIEQHVLGCGGGLQAEERALSLVGFCSSAASAESSAPGLQLLLRRKHEANTALRAYLQHRVPAAAPTLQSPCGSKTEDGGSAGAAAAAALERFGRSSPAMDDRSHWSAGGFPVHLRTLDSVRDRSLWAHLDRLSSPTCAASAREIEPLLVELDRLLRVHRLTELAPSFRRAFLSTWLLPEQIPKLLEVWERRQPPPHLMMTTLARSFPGAFLPHMQAILSQLQGRSAGNAEAALQMLGALGKWVRTQEDATAVVRQLPSLQGDASLAHTLVEALRGQTSLEEAGRIASLCRKAVQACALAPGAQFEEMLSEILHLAEAEKCSVPVFCHLAAACFETIRPRGTPGAHENSVAGWDAWRIKSHDILQSEGHKLDAHLAALRLAAAAGSEDVVVATLSAATTQELRLPPFAPLSLLRAMRRGTLPVTSGLLLHLATQLRFALQVPEDHTEGLSLPDKAVSEFQKLQKLSKVGARRADRLRLCSTLPALFALAPLKRHREAMSRSLQALLLGVAQQSGAQQEQLLDFSLACFLHFLSRLEFFRQEAAAVAPAFPESTKLAAFVCDALVRSDPARCTELAGVGLRVCERMPLFVDREDPGSTTLQQAAHVLRYAMERRCPELGAHGLVGAASGSVPAQLFRLRSEVQLEEEPPRLGFGVGTARSLPPPEAESASSQPQRQARPQVPPQVQEQSSSKRQRRG